MHESAIAQGMSRTRFSAWALAVVWGLAACTALPEAQAPKLGTWLELTTPHFRVRTNTDESLARATVESLEQTRAAMLGAAWHAKQGPPGRTDVIVFARSSELMRYLSAYSFWETQSERGLARLMVFAQEEAGGGLPFLAAHELAHDLSYWYMPFQPRWLDEGLANFLGTVRIDARARQAVVGLPPPERFATLSERSIDTAALLGMAGNATRPRHRRNARAEAWLLTHYLVFQWASSFGLFQQRLAELQDWRLAWETEFGSELAPGPGLDAQLLKHLSAHADWVTGVVPLPLEPVQMTLRPLAESEVHALLARLLSTKDPERMRSELARAFELDPNNLDALEVSFYFSRLALSDARSLAARALATHPDSAVAWAMAVDADLKPKDEATLRTALSFDPLDPRALELLARAELLAQHSESAFVHASIALRRSAPFRELTELYFNSALQSGHCEQASAIAHNSFLSDDLGRRLSWELSGSASPCAAPAR